MACCRKHRPYTVLRTSALTARDLSDELIGLKPHYRTSAPSKQRAKPNAKYEPPRRTSGFIDI